MTGGRRFSAPGWGPDHLTLDAVVAYVDDELDAGAHGRADAHLAGCPQCRAEVVAQRQARAALRTAAGPRLPSSLLHTLRAIPVEAELPPPPPGLGITADGQFVLLRDVPRNTDVPGLGDVPRTTGPHGPPRRTSRRARFGAVSGLAIGALAVGALAAPGPAAPPAAGVLGGAVLDGPQTAGRAVPGDAVARLDVGTGPARPATPDPSRDGPAEPDPAESADPSVSPSPSSTAEAVALLDASLRQRFARPAGPGP